MDKVVTIPYIDLLLAVLIILAIIAVVILIGVLKKLKNSLDSVEKSVNDLPKIVEKIDTTVEKANKVLDKADKSMDEINVITTTVKGDVVEKSDKKAKRSNLLSGITDLFTDGKSDLISLITYLGLGVSLTSLFSPKKKRK